MTLSINFRDISDEFEDQLLTMIDQATTIVLQDMVYASKSLGIRVVDTYSYDNLQILSELLNAITNRRWSSLDYPWETLRGLVRAIKDVSTESEFETVISWLKDNID